MNRPTRSDAARWQAQERALRTPPGVADHLLAHALRTRIASGPPDDFAAAVARAAATRPGDRPVGDQTERLLLRGLTGAMVLSAGVCALVYFGVWMNTLQSALGGNATTLALGTAACLGLSTLPWQRLLSRRVRAPAGV